MARTHPRIKAEKFLMRGVNDGEGHIFRFTKPVTVPRSADVQVGVTRPDFPTNGAATVTVRTNDKANRLLDEKHTEGVWETDPNLIPSNEEE